MSGAPEDRITAKDSVSIVKIDAQERREPTVLSETVLLPASIKDTLNWSADWVLDKRPVDAVQWINAKLPPQLLERPAGLAVPAKARVDETSWSLWLRNASPEYRKAYDELRLEFAETVGVDRVKWHGNLLVNAGMDLIWDGVIGNSITEFSNANAHIGVGDSSTAAAVSQTDLQASTNKLRKAMNATFPDQPANSQIRFQSDFTGAEANFAWLEVGTFNASSGGTMLQRVVPGGGLGTKSSGATWTLTLTITLS